MAELISIGRILRPHGVRGELVVDAPPEAVDDLASLDTLYVGEPPVPCALAEVRWHRGRLLVRLAGCDDRDAAEAYRGRLVQIEAPPSAPLPPGVYYQRQILGLTVVTDAGETLGRIESILETGANDVYVVQGEGGEVLIPAAPGVVQQVDLENGRMIVHLLEGLR